MSNVPAAALALLASGSILGAAELRMETLNEWNRYIAKTESDIAAWQHSNEPLLRSDKAPEVIRRMRAGEIVVAPVGHNPKPIAGGLIHHWGGAAFIPHATIDDVFAAIRDYGRYKEYYAPLVNIRPILQVVLTDSAGNRIEITAQVETADSIESFLSSSLVAGT